MQIILQKYLKHKADSGHRWVVMKHYVDKPFTDWWHSRATDGPHQAIYAALLGMFHKSKSRDTFKSNKVKMFLNMTYMDVLLN